MWILHTEGLGQCRDSAAKRVFIGMHVLHHAKRFGLRCLDDLPRERNASSPAEARRSKQHGNIHRGRNSDAMNGIAEGGVCCRMHDVAGHCERTPARERGSLHLCDDDRWQCTDPRGELSEPLDKDWQQIRILHTCFEIESGTKCAAMGAENDDGGCVVGDPWSHRVKRGFKLIEERRPEGVSAMGVVQRERQQTTRALRDDLWSLIRRHEVPCAKRSRGAQGNVHREAMPSRAKQIWLVRHAETEWSVNGRHTGRSDIALTAAGVARANELGPALAAERFDLVLSSPRSRALETARHAGFGATVEVEEGLAEWDYGDYEGLTSAEIAARSPGWDLWRVGCPGGESIDAVAARAERVIKRCLATPGNVLLFSHGHFTRMLAAVWLELVPTRGRSFGLKAGSISVLGFEHENRVIWQWDRVDAFEGH